MTKNHAIVVKDLEKNLESDLLTVTEEKRTAIEGTIHLKKFLLEDTPSALISKSIFPSKP